MTILSAVLSALIILTAVAVFAAPAFALWLAWRIGTAAASREARTGVKIKQGGESAAKRGRGGRLRRVEASRGISESEAI